MSVSSITIELKESIIHLILTVWKLTMCIVCAFVDIHLNDKIILSIYFKLEYNLVPLSSSHSYISDCRNTFHEIWPVLFIPRILDAAWLVWFYNIPSLISIPLYICCFCKKKKIKYALGIIVTIFLVWERYLL